MTGRAQNVFTEEGGEEQAKEAKDFADDYRYRDTYRRSEKKGRYRRRGNRGREDAKKSGSPHGFQTKDDTFTKGRPTGMEQSQQGIITN